MNSSEIKKIIWGFSLIIFVGLIFVSLFVYQQLSLPINELKPFDYNEPSINSKPDTYIRVTRADVEKEFGWIKPEEIKKTDIEKKHGIAAEIVPAIQNINDIFTLNVILGKLAFVYIIKDDQLKSLIKDDEIIDKKGEVLGVLKEIYEESVLILFKGKIEELNMDGEIKSYPAIMSVYNTRLNTSFLPHEPRISNVKNALSEQIKNQISRKDNTVIKQTYTIDGAEFEVAQSVDADGLVNRKINEDLKLKLQTKEWRHKMTSSKNYELEYQSSGILIKSIKDPEVQKLFSAFGIASSDIILSVNGQNLGNKTEDDLIALYQQISDTAKTVTIELLKNNVRQKFRFSK